MTYKHKKSFNLAERNGTLCKKCSYGKAYEKSRKYNLNFLLENTDIAHYYLGLIIADGSFYKTRFELCLKEEDSEIIFKELANLCGGCKIHTREIDGNNYSRIYFQNKISVENVKNKFKIPNRKTYNPIDFNVFKNYNKKSLMSLLIGIIDGDGSTYINNKNKSPQITITAHKNWQFFYKKLFQTLDINISIVKKSKNTWDFKIGSTNKILEIYNFAKNNNLIKLKRKWIKFQNLKPTD